MPTFSSIWTRYFSSFFQNTFGLGHYSYAVIKTNLKIVLVCIVLFFFFDFFRLKRAQTTREKLRFLATPPQNRFTDHRLACPPLLVNFNCSCRRVRQPNSNGHRLAPRPRRNRYRTPPRCRPLSCYHEKRSAAHRLNSEIPVRRLTRPSRHFHARLRRRFLRTPPPYRVPSRSYFRR